MLIFLYIVYGYLSISVAKLSSSSETAKTTKFKILSIFSHTKSFLTPTLEDCELQVIIFKKLL